MRLACLLATALFAACSSTNPPNGTGVDDDASASDDGGDETGSTAGADTTVTAFSKEEVSFTGMVNKRTVDKDAEFPATGTYEKITLHLTLDCPAGHCDEWDRFGTLGVVTAKGDKPENDTVIEVARYMTPYGVGGSWDFDVTDLRPLLKGKLTMRAFIDTWVGPGSSSGNGWLVTAAFDMKGGTPAKEPIAVLPIWTMHSGAYGDPAKPLSGSFPEQTLTLPSGASSYAVRTFVTGHGQGNLDNCAEFCPRSHTIKVGGVGHTEKIWRTDCGSNPITGHSTAYKYPRAGWCPGADVHVWTFDATADLAAGNKVSYDVETYENSCRPGVATCMGCAFSTGCDYDGMSHTEPVYYLSSLLIAYK